MDWVHFTPGSALLGGVMIGLAASLLWWSLGRVAGISGIAVGLLSPRAGDFGWRAAFVAGLLAAGALAAAAAPSFVTSSSLRGAGLMLAGGFVVGFGARLSGGCTAGHGVCGLSRLSPRSLAATVTFMATAMATATLLRVGGAP
jgi:uncharacterized membrane protein YedE/YeeE